MADDFEWNNDDGDLSTVQKQFCQLMELSFGGDLVIRGKYADRIGNTVIDL